MTQNTNGNVFLFFIPYLYVSYTNDTIYIYTIRKLQASLPNPSTNKMLRVSTFQAFKSLSFNRCLCNFETLNKQFHLSLRKLKAEGFQASGFSYSVSLPYLSQLLCCQQFDSSARVAVAMPVKRKSKGGAENPKSNSKASRKDGGIDVDKMFAKFPHIPKVCEWWLSGIYRCCVVLFACHRECHVSQWDR